MKNLLFILLLLPVFLFGQTGEIKPITAKPLQTPNNATLHFNKPDTTLGIHMGSYGYMKIAGAKKVRWQLDSIARATQLNYVPYTGATKDVNLGTYNITTDGIQFNTTPSITPTTGLFYWDNTEKTIQVVHDATAGVTGSVNKEMYITAVNKTGIQINDGQVVYCSGSQGNRPTISLARADNISTALWIGVATQNITNNQEGSVTIIGEVHGYNTSGFTVGDLLYISSSTAGTLTNIIPSTPNYNAPVARALNSTNNGTILVFQNPVLALDVAMTANTDLVAPSQKAVKTYTDTKVPFTVLDDSKDLTGFLSGSTINVSYDWITRTATLAGDLTYYWRGVKKTLTSPWTSSAHTATIGKWYLYSSDGVNFVWSQSVWSFDMVQVMAVTYKATAAASIAIRETHGLMPWQVHEEMHQQIGTYLISGGQATAGTYIIGTPTDAANTPGFDAFVLKDEDNNSTEAAWIEGTYTTMYITTGTTSVFNIAATLPFMSAGSYIQWNNPIDGSITTSTNNKYLNVYSILVPVASSSNSQKYRVIMLQPQAEFTTLTAAQGENVSGLSLGDLASYSPEFKINARLTYVTNSGDANTGKCRLASITYVLGSNGSVLNVPLTSSNHAALSNLPWAISGHLGTNNNLASFDGSGLATYTPKTDFASSSVVNSLTTNYIPYWDGTKLVNSQISQGVATTIDNTYAGVLIKKNNVNKFLIADDSYVSTTRPNAFGLYVYGNNPIDLWSNSTRIASFSYAGVEFTGLSGTGSRFLVSSSTGKIENASLEYLNVKLNGIVADGVTDETSAIQTLITNNRSVYFPAGTYLVSTLNIPSDTRILTDGYLTIFKEKSGVVGDYPVLNIIGSRVHIDNCKIQGNITTDTGEQRHAIEAYASASTGNLTDITIGNIIAENVRGDGLYIGKATGYSIQQVTVGAIFANNVYRNGVSITGGKDIYIKSVVGTAVGLITFDAEPNIGSGTINNVIVDYIKGHSTQVAGSSASDYCSNFIINNLDINPAHQSYSTPAYSNRGSYANDGLVLRNIKSIHFNQAKIEGFNRMGINCLYSSGELGVQGLSFNSLDISDCSKTDVTYYAYIMAPSTDLTIKYLKASATLVGIRVFDALASGVLDRVDFTFSNDIALLRNCSGVIINDLNASGTVGGPFVSCTNITVNKGTVTSAFLAAYSHKCTFNNVTSTNSSYVFNSSYADHFISNSTLNTVYYPKGVYERSYLLPINFGGNYLWVDASTNLRIKSSWPTSDTDGTIIGPTSLTGYVPYTGATSTLNLGAQNFTLTGTANFGTASSFPWSTTAEFKSTMRIFDGASSSYGLRFGFSSNKPYLQGYRETVGVVDIALQKDGGNVGISTVSPVGKFSVQGSQQVGFNAAITGSPQSGNLFYQTDGTGWKFDIGKYQGSAFTSQMTFQDNGNIGVGTITAAEKFTVSGNILANGGLVTSNSATALAASSGFADFVREDYTTNTILTNIRLRRRTTGTAAAGIGSAFSLRATNSAAADANTGYFAGSLENVTAGSEVGQMVISPDWQNSQTVSTSRAVLVKAISSTRADLFVPSGNIALGNITSPTGRIHLPAGTTSASSAPIKFTAGTNMTAAEAGALEWDGSNLFITQTTGPTRKTIAYTSDITNAYSWYLQTNGANTQQIGNGMTVNIKSGTGITLSQTNADITISASGGTTTNAVTFNNSGTGAASGATFDGSAAKTISYNTVGAAALAGSSSQDFSSNQLTAAGALVSSQGELYLNGKMINNVSGNLSFGNTDGSYRMVYTTSNGNLYIPGTLTQNSDRKLKRNIKNLSSIDFNNINKIDFHKFSFKNDTTNKIHYGVIAQDVERYLPELVTEQSDGKNTIKSVNYIELLVAKIASLEEKIKMLEEKIK